MTPIAEAMLIAYLDDELAAEERARVNAALVLDAPLQARLRRQERVREILSEVFDTALQQRVPDRLVNTVMQTPIPMRWRVRSALALPFSGASLVGVARAWAPHIAPAAMALAIGLVLGWLTGARGADGLARGGLVAEGGLARALERQLARDAAQSGPRVAVSFRARDGRLCRTFELGAARGNLAGVACRDESAWTIVALAATEPAGRGPASAATPDLVRQAVAQMMAGQPLDAEGERRARQAGWR